MSKHFGSFRLGILIIILNLTFLSAFAQRVPTDFNNDGLSELVIVATDHPLSWSAVDVESGQSSDLGSLGAVGDNIILGDWLGLGSPQIGVVKVQKNSSVLWRIKNADGENVDSNFGSPGNIALSALDLDKSGAADSVAISKNDNKFVWTILYDPMLGGTTTKDVSFGSISEKPFYIDTNGSGARFGLFSSSKIASKVRLMDPQTGVIKIIRNLPALSPKAKNAFDLAIPLKDQAGKEILVLISSLNNKTMISTIDLEKKQTKKGRRLSRLKSKSVPVSGDVAIGNFLNDAGYELAIKTSLGVFIWNIFDNATKMVSVPDGVLVDELNINQLKSAPVSNPPAGDPSDDDPLPPPSEDVPDSLADVCAGTSAIGAGEMLIKSEASNHINNGDARSTGYTVVCGSLCPQGLSYVPFYYSNGELAGAVGYYGRFSGNGQPRLYGAAGQAPQHFASQIAARAAQIGNGKLYLRMKTDGSLCKEFNPSGRNGSL